LYILLSIQIVNTTVYTMGRVSKMVSFDSEKDLPVINKMPLGTLSSICQKAVREWGGILEKTIDELIKEQAEIEEQEQTIQARREFIELQIAEKKAAEEAKLRELERQKEFDSVKERQDAVLREKRKKELKAWADEEAEKKRKKLSTIGKIEPIAAAILEFKEVQLPDDR
jgi:hypothetical protein